MILTLQYAKKSLPLSPNHKCFFMGKGIQKGLLRISNIGLLNISNIIREKKRPPWLQPICKFQQMNVWIWSEDQCLVLKSIMAAFSNTWKMTSTLFSPPYSTHSCSSLLASSTCELMCSCTCLKHGDSSAQRADLRRFDANNLAQPSAHSKGTPCLSHSGKSAMVWARLLVIPAKLLYHPAQQIQGHNPGTLPLTDRQSHAEEQASKRLLTRPLTQPGKVFCCAQNWTFVATVRANPT